MDSIRKVHIVGGLISAVMNYHSPGLLRLNETAYNSFQRRLSMEIITVEELIVPLEEYATVGKDGTLFDAFMALEKAQGNFDNNRYLHRAI